MIITNLPDCLEFPPRDFQLYKTIDNIYTLILKNSAYDKLYL